MRPRLAFVVAAAVASLAAAGDPSGITPRQVHLLRALDAWQLDLSIAVAMTGDPYAAVRQQAAGVLASNPRFDRLRLIGIYAGDGDARVRARAMLAAGRLGAAGLPVAKGGLDDRVPLVRQAAAWAACHGGPEALSALEKRLRNEQDRPVLETLLANLWRLGDAPWQPLAATYAGSGDPYLRRAAAYSLARAEEPAERAALRRLAADNEPVIRATAVAGFARSALDGADDQKAVLAATADADWRVRTAAYRVLAAREEIEIPQPVAARVASDLAAARSHLAVSAVAVAGAHPEVVAAPALRELVEGDRSWLAAEALAAMARRDCEAAVPVAAAWLQSADLWRCRAAARAAAVCGGDLEAAAAAADAAAVRLAWLESLDAGQAAARVERLRKLLDGDPDPAVRAQALALLEAAEAAPGFEDLLGLATRWSRDLMPDARAQALTTALRAAGPDTARRQVLAIALSDADPVVAAMAVNAARELDMRAELPAREPRHGNQWYAELAEWLETPRWLDVETSRGSFRIRLDLEAAPLSAREISLLAADGFYDGLPFHRVVPNFVVQGGDPRGDGWGGPGFALPDEPSLVPFDSWRVGIATSGPQTGGCQLFVTLLPADHLTGHYTNLGEVVEGRDVLTELEVGDTIVSIRPLSGPDPPPLDAAE